MTCSCGKPSMIDSTLCQDCYDEWLRSAKEEFERKKREEEARQKESSSDSEEKD